MLTAFICTFFINCNEKLNYVNAKNSTECNAPDSIQQTIYPYFPLKNKNEIRVMVIDSGVEGHTKLKPYMPEYNQNHINYSDTHGGHGTHVAGIVLYGNKNKESKDLDKNAVCKNVKLYSCNYIKPGSINMIDDEIECFKLALEKRIDIVNFSSSGTGISQKEKEIFSKYVDTGGIIVVSAGNNTLNVSLSNIYPAKYAVDFTPIRGVYPISSLRKNAKSPKDYYYNSNYHSSFYSEIGEEVFSTFLNDTYTYKTGTSQAAPAFTYRLLKKKCEELNE